jgi:nucleotide-binding universal stress UspA family protein
MRVLVTIPHYVRPGETSADGRVYGALAADSEPRLRALIACLTALHQSFGAPPCFIHHGRRIAEMAEAVTPNSVDVVICTTRGHHLLDRLGVAPRYYTHHATDVEPLLLGFACHAVLRDRLGSYDYFCYMEDDLIVHDPWFFHKLAWFNRQVGDDKLLQANRFEACLNHLVAKVYVDGELNPAATAPFQNLGDSPPLVGEAFGMRVQFQRTLNPHSGCFFLNARQMGYWASQPHFTDHASRFIGPLETAASLGIMRTFKIYRPAPANADFLEVQHAGTGYLEQLCAPAEGSA